MTLFVRPNGRAESAYDDALAPLLHGLGACEATRASRVEPYTGHGGRVRWAVYLTDGFTAMNFESRADALAWENYEVERRLRS